MFERCSIIVRISRALKCFHSFGDVPNLRSRRSVNISLSFLALKCSKRDKIKGPEQMGRMRRKCNQYDISFCEQLLDLLIDMRPTAVAE
jgi:hypothetical protein